MLVSIAIPVYEMNSMGRDFLDISLKNISNQTYKNIQVVISDHSVNSDIEELCDLYSKNLNVLYLKNTEKRGSSSANLNNAIINCKGQIIKILMQDEFLYDNLSIEKIANIFKNNKSVYWLVSGCIYGPNEFDLRGSMYPIYSSEITKGVNTIGSPSMLTIKNENLELFNENLLWVMDCEYYKRMFDKFGEPTIINEHQIFVAQHKNQVTSILSEEVKNAEVDYLIKKYSYEFK
jgi:glycosyltransferase involved in cell wall biosynthesis